MTNKNIDWNILYIEFKEGTTITELSKEYKISRNQIYNHFKKNNVDYIISEEKREKKRKKEIIKWFWKSKLKHKYLFTKEKIKDYFNKYGN